MIAQPDKAQAFLFALAASGGNVSQACEQAGISRQTAYRWQEGDIEFASAWDDALDPDKQTAAAGAEDEEEDEPPKVDVTPSYPGARYRLTEQAYIDDRLHEPDTIVEYAGIPGPHMIACNEAARAAKLQVTGYRDEQIELADFLNDATVRKAELGAAIGEVKGKLLIARGRQYIGSEVQRATAASEVAGLLQSMKALDAELVQIDPMIEEAQASADGAAAERHAAMRRDVLAKMEAGLAKRDEHARQIALYAGLIGAHMREMLQLGDDAWRHVRINSSENTAASCVPDPNAVSKALVGALLRSHGLSLDGIAQLSNVGLENLRGFEGPMLLISRQNDAMRARFQ